MVSSATKNWTIANGINYIENIISTIPSTGDAIDSDAIERYTLIKDWLSELRSMKSLVSYDNLRVKFNNSYETKEVRELILKTIEEFIDEATQYNVINELKPDEAKEFIKMIFEDEPVQYTDFTNFINFMDDLIKARISKSAITSQSTNYGGIWEEAMVQQYLKFLQNQITEHGIYLQYNPPVELLKEIVSDYIDTYPLVVLVDLYENHRDEFDVFVDKYYPLPEPKENSEKYMDNISEKSEYTEKEEENQ